MSDVITNNLDLWTSALLTKSTTGRGNNGRVEAYGIKKLRELILELAVRGKLVPQDPNDEPASVLLEKIASEKERLMKNGKIKKQPRLSDIPDEEMPFLQPKGWAWDRLGNLSTQITDGVHHTPNYVEGGVPFISVKDIDGRTVSFDDCKYISQEQHEGINSRCNPEYGDLLICRIGTLGRATIVDSKKPFSLFVSVGLIKFLQHYFTPQFAHIVLHSPLLVNQYEQVKAGGSHTNKLNLGDLPGLTIPVAPLAEQHRIVAKVDELMALCDKLEQKQIDSIEAHHNLVETLLGTLTNVESQQELIEAWTRIADHFDILFTTGHSIDQLKQTILQLAVMGKLVPQDPCDEPASMLLGKINIAKEKLIEEGSIKNQDSLPEVENKDAPFELPDGWSYVRLGELSKLITKGSSPKWQGVSYTDDPTDVLFVTSENVGNYVLLLENRKYVEKKFNDVEPRSILKKGDFLMNIVGASIGRTAVYDIDDIANINQAVCLIRVFSELLDRTYLLHFFNSAICVSYMFDKQVDNARANLSMGNIAKFVIPLPPFAEQRRIIAKVNELMALCDALKVHLADAQTTHITLANAIVEQAIA
jgi:type I restriction enzyme, S subunit